MRRLLLGCEAGLVAGTLVGVAEALAVLSLAASASDYVALCYAAVLYGLAGIVPGLAVGMLLAPLGRRIEDDTAFSLAGLGTAALLVVFVAAGHGALPALGELSPVARGGLGLGAFALGRFALYLGGILLTRTPLKALMRPKGTLALWGATLGLTAVFSFAPGGPGGDGPLAPEREQPPHFASKPNVLVLVVDSLRPDHLGAYGYPHPTSAALDSLAADSVLFERAYAHSSETRTSVASLLGGLLPPTHGVRAAAPVLPDAVVTFPELANAAGYVTGGFANDAALARGLNFQQGFDHYRFMKPAMPLWGTESVAQLALYAALREQLDHARRDSRRPTDFYTPAADALQHARTFIEAQDDRRWLLMVHLMDAHEPYFERPLNGRCVSRAETPMPDPAERAELVRRYDDAVRSLDAQLAALLDWLRSTGRYDDTVIVLTAEHGVEFLDHGGWWSGQTLYDEQLRVPLLIKLAGRDLAGTRAGWTVRQIDLAPTLASLMGLEPDPSWQGQDLLDEAGESALRMLEDAARARSLPDPPPLPDPRALSRPVLAELRDGELQVSALYDNGYKLIRATGSERLPGEALFAPEQDPGETRDLAGADLARQSALARALVQEQENAVAHAARLGLTPFAFEPR